MVHSSEKILMYKESSVQKRILRNLSWDISLTAKPIILVYHYYNTGTQLAKINTKTISEKFLSITKSSTPSAENVCKDQQLPSWHIVTLMNGIQQLDVLKIFKLWLVLD